MEQRSTPPAASAALEDLSIVDYLFALVPGQACPATALYRSACDCRSKVVVPTGAPCPPCPDCGTTPEWDFVRIVEAEDHRLSA
jgi:hypothetical protein